MKIGNPLSRLNFNQQRFEADFRFSLVRLRENSESVAFYGGESKEQSNFRGQFSKVLDNFWAIMLRQKKLAWFTSGYGQIAIIFPYLVAAPRYFTKQITLGGLVQISSAFGTVQDALSFIVDSYTSLAEWHAVVNRLTGFVNNMDKVRQTAHDNHGTQIIKDSSKILKVINLDVKLPNGRVLVEGFNLELGVGDTLLISGPSGSGKSTLMRAMAGIWPFGQGTVNIPQGQNVLFLPQKSYLPLGTLREILLYPSTGTTVTDEVIKETMRLCKLEWLQDQLDTVEDWSHILSLGEQQRIAFARVLLQQPLWLFLDEATSALDEPTEQWMYELLKERLKNTAVVSIGHRNTLKGFHKQTLFIDGTGKWSLLS
jgi:vitamin B12/bleomycin/antimicrobial peptide transport system ATP-binding/permease protein